MVLERDREGVEERVDELDVARVEALALAR